MAENENFDKEELAITRETSFSQLLLAEDNTSKGAEGNNSSFNFASSNSPLYISSSVTFSTGIEKIPKMLCFGDYPEKVNQELVFSNNTTKACQRSRVTCSDSCSSVSSANSIKTLCRSINKKRDGSDHLSNAVSQNQRTSKKTKTENPTSTIPAKKKEKLGKRIAALQQLVSPFGKTDTASVLHEAMGYIKFLQDQVQVLCSPYLHHLPLLPEKGRRGGNGKEKEMRKDLRSRGLCLVPVECTVNVANSNGADFWSPAMANNILSSSTN